jgi:hypothetical protein
MLLLGGPVGDQFDDHVHLLWGEQLEALNHIKQVAHLIRWKLLACNHLDLFLL